MPLPRYSCCIVPQKPDHCRENHARVPPSRAGRRNKRRRMRWSMRSRRSDAPLFDGDVNANCCEELDPFYGRLDINSATAEELMTLPGINRTTATNVVTYRAHIGGFRKVEDVALVPGVGATRFGHMRPEIYVGDSFLPPPSTMLRRSGSSATSSGIDVSLTPVDSVSREFTVASVPGLQTSPPVHGQTANTDARLRPDTSMNTRSAAEYDDEDVVQVDGDRPSTLTTDLEALQRRRRWLQTTSEVGWSEDSGAVRVATWNLWPCSSKTLDDVSLGELVAATLRLKR